MKKQERVQQVEEEKRCVKAQRQRAEENRKRKQA